MTRQRWIGIAGIVFVILVVASFFAVPNTPHPHASVTKMLSYYHSHKTGLRVSTYLTEVAVFVGLGFFWYFRTHLVERNPASSRLATLGFAGAVVFGVSGAAASGISWSLADGVDHVGSAAMQALNVLNTDLFLFLGAPGIAVFLAATGMAAVYHRVLPVWLGWAGIVLAIVALVIGYFGLLGIGLWILAASITILVRPEPATQATTG